jgi:hypothetical protein
MYIQIDKSEKSRVGGSTMIRKYCLLAAIVAILGVVVLVAPASAFAKADHHHSGKEMVGEKIKTDGHHEIDRVGEHRVSVHVVNGKVAGLHVKHSKKGDVPVTKYKTHKKMADMRGNRSARYTLVQEDLGMTYIGYAFIDDYGDQHIYWFPYEMILDGDTGAIDYVPLS